MRGIKQAAGLAIATSALAAASLAVAGPANAVASPAEACGPNYHEIDHENLDGGVVHLLYDGKTNCVVATKTKDAGKKTVNLFASVWRETESSTVQTNEGRFEQYAGPVKVDAQGKCIGWGGGVGQSTYGVKDKARPHCG